MQETGDYSFSIGTLEIFFAGLTFIGGIAVSFVTMAIRDAVLKNTFKHRLEALEIFKLEKETLDKVQDGKIAKGELDLMKVRENLQHARENFDRFHEQYREDLKENRKSTNELTSAISGLKATIEGVGGLIKRFDDDLREVRAKQS